MNCVVVCDAMVAVAGETEIPVSVPPLTVRLAATGENEPYAALTVHAPPWMPVASPDEFTEATVLSDDVQVALLLRFFVVPSL